MRIKMKRFWGILLSFVMVLGLMPGMSLTAYADGTTYNPASTYTGFGDLNTNNTEVTISEVPEKTWYVIAYDSSTVTLLSKQSFGSQQFNSDIAMGNDYKTSKIKIYVDGLKGEGQPLAGISSVISDLTLIDTATAQALSETKRKGEGTTWWLCSPSTDTESHYYAAFVNGKTGEVNESGGGVTSGGGVRPALKLDLTKVTFDSLSNTFTYNASSDTSVASVTVGDTTTNYTSFRDAMSAWGDGSTLTLLDNVTVEKGFAIGLSKTLNTNDHTLTITSREEPGISIFNATLTVTGTGTLNVNGGATYMAIDGNGTLIVDGATVEATGHNGDDENINGCTAIGSLTLIVNSGTVKAIGGNGNNAMHNSGFGIVGEVTINGGEVYAIGGTSVPAVLNKPTAGNGKVLVSKGSDNEVSEWSSVNDVYNGHRYGYFAAVVPEPVASVTVGDTTTNYISFRDAMSAWQADTTLTLLDDVAVEDNCLQIIDSKTLNTNGKTLTITNDNLINGISIVKNVTLTVTGTGTLNVKGGAADHMAITGDGTLIVDGATVNATGHNGDDENINGCTAICIDTLIVNSGTIKAIGGNGTKRPDNGGIGIVGKVTINGGEVYAIGGTGNGTSGLAAVANPTAGTGKVLVSKGSETEVSDWSNVEAVYDNQRYGYFTVDTVATPTFNPAAGTYSSAQTVSISTTTAGATIRYTTDGTEPTATSPEYHDAITVKKTTTIKAKAFKDDASSDVASATYTIKTTQETTTKPTDTTPKDEVSTVYRLYYGPTMEHFYTTSAYERRVLIDKYGWVDEGIAWKSPKAPTTDEEKKTIKPVYRLFNPFTTDHHYTKDANERKTLIDKYGWKDEGVAFYSNDKGDATVYRLWHPGLITGAHHFTTGKHEYDVLITRGWVGETEAFKVNAAS